MVHRDESNPAPRGEASGDEPTAEQGRRRAQPSIRQIDRYRILHVIGTGGMATVYAALQPTPRRTVALKVLRPEVVDDTAIRRFRREAEILGRLRHPSIAQVYDAGTFEQDGRQCPYFVMEFIPGAKTILEYVAQKQFNRRDRLKLFVTVCRAVHYGHQHRVLHRDLKPGNILVDQSGRLKIIDFGVASAPGLRVSGTTMNTEAGRLVGTIQYMSPEQVSANPQNIDVRSDVYGLGVLLYKLMTGQFPYHVQGQPIYEAIRMIREDDPVRPSRQDSELRGDLETIILRAIAKDPAQRYRSVSEMADDIVRYLNRQPIKAKSAGPAHRAGLWVRRQRGRIAGGIVVLLLLGGAVAATTWWLTRDDGSTTAQQPNAAERRGTTGWSNATTDDLTGPRPIVLTRQKGTITALSFDGSSILATGASDHSLIVWDMQSYEPALTIAQHEDALRRVAFSESGHRGVSLDAAGVMVEFDTTAQSPPSRLDAPFAAVNDIAFDDAGTHLAMACEDSTVRVHDFATEQWTTIRGTTGPFQCVAFSADGNRLVAGSQRGEVYVFDTSTGERESRLDGLRGAVVRATFDPSGMFAVAADSDGRAMVWNLQPVESSGPTIGDPHAGRAFDAAAATLRASAVSPSRQWFVAAASREIRLWDLRPLQAGNPIEQHGPTIELKTTVQSIAIDANAQRLAIGLHEGTVHVYAVADLIEWAQARNAAAATPTAPSD